MAEFTSQGNTDSLYVFTPLRSRFFLRLEKRAQPQQNYARIVV
jgi:hypothetical protein